MNKLLSVVIPTKNRQVYCLESAQSILEDLDSRCEIVIQDNSEDDSLKKDIERLNDSRIVYNYNSQPLSFIDNFEQALDLSNGEYFIILGDDDSTTKDIVKVVEWMQSNNIESVACSKVIDYIWPNEKIEKYKDGLLHIPVYSNSMKEVDCSVQIENLIKNGFLAYQNFDLPRTYHGIIKRSCMEEVRRLSGRFFGGLTPDIYSTIALACVVKRHVIIDYPFSIAGACPASATVNATVGGHSGRLNDAPHFRNRGEYQWESSIPSYYSVETIWAESAIKALKDIGKEDLLKDFNNYKLYVYSILLNRKYILNLAVSETIKIHKNLSLNIVNHSMKLIFTFEKVVLSVLFNRLFNKNKKIIQNFFINGVSNLKSAKIILGEKLGRINL